MKAENIFKLLKQKQMDYKKFTYTCIYDKGFKIKIQAFSEKLAENKLNNIVKSRLTFKLD